MLRRLFSRAAPDKARAPSTGGGLVYAVGDVHGRLDVLEPLIDQIRADAAASETASRPLVIFIGDYVDRGPQSKGVVDAILALSADPGLEVRTLKGNHEAQLLSFLQDPREGPPWMDFGGAETLLSYGVRPPPSRIDLGQWDQARHAFAGALPAEHLAFFSGLELALVCGDYLFVHAGVRPGVPLETQSERDLLWIRDEFLQVEKACDKVVVHGHTPEASPHIGRYRIGIDTGAYATATLTCVRLQDEAQAVLQARPRPS